MTLEIILIIFSIVLSAFFSSSEAAFLSIQKTKLFHMVNLKQKGADRVASLLENKDKLLSTIVLGNNIVNITFGRGVGYIFEEEVFDESVNSISATKIRRKLREEGKID